MEIKAPSGKVYNWTRPPRHIHWKHGRVGQAFAVKMQEIQSGSNGLDDTEKGIRLMESLSDSEVTKLQTYVDDVLRAGLGYEPDEVPEPDYWYLFGQAVYSRPDAIVETTEGETDVETVTNFRPESALSEAGESVADVRGEAIAEDGPLRPASL